MTHIELADGTNRDAEIHESPGGDWQALYLDGILHSQGHIDDVASTLLRLIGVKIIHDDAFLRGGNGGSSNNTAPTTGDIDQWASERDTARSEAAELRLQANRLTAEAARIEQKFASGATGR